MLTNLKLYGIIALAGLLAALAGSTWFEHQRYLTTKAQYDGFVAQAQALAAQQLAENAAKEKAYANQVHTAESDRDAALKRLRDSQADTDRLRMSVTPEAAAGTDRVCFTRTGLDRAIQSFLADVQGFLEEGDSALIDDQAWAKAWPR